MKAQAAEAWLWIQVLWAQRSVFRKLALFSEFLVRNEVS